MTKFLATMKKITFLMIATIYLLTSLIFLLPDGYKHSHMNIQENCHYILGSQTFCKMNFVEYMGLWGNLFFVPFNNFFKLILFIFLFYIGIVLSIVFLLHKIIDKKIFSPPDFLLIRQIINPRAP